MSSNFDDVSRRDVIPVIYTSGTHYEVGFNVGCTLSSLINTFLNNYEHLQELIQIYELPEGRKVYDETLACVQENFPQYVDEIRGMADGSKISFYKLFLLHIDDILQNTIKSSVYSAVKGCSDVWMNSTTQKILGHTEDARIEMLNQVYIVSANIKSDKPLGRWKVSEEHFTALCYPGYLPGYTMGYNSHGMILTINTLCPRPLLSGKTPSAFMTRALLAAANIEQVTEILYDEGCGSAEGFAANMIFINNDEKTVFYNAEVAPSQNENVNRSSVSLITIHEGQSLIHCNSYLRLETKEADALTSSEERYRTLTRFPKPQAKEDILNMLGDQSCEYPVFRDNRSLKTLTVCVGVFDLFDRTFSIYIGNPKTSNPTMVLPIVLRSQLGSH